MADQSTVDSDLDGVSVMRIVRLGRNVRRALETVRIGAVARSPDLTLVVDVADSLRGIRSRSPDNPKSRCGSPDYPE